jgi:hypothetical protein
MPQESKGPATPKNGLFGDPEDLLIDRASSSVSGPKCLE